MSTWEEKSQVSKRALPTFPGAWTELTSIVAVDAAQWPAILRNHTVDDDVSGPSIRGAIATGTDNLPVVLGVEVLDRNGSAAVELEDLVVGIPCSAADDVGSLVRGLLECGGVFADILPPNVLQGAVIQ